MLSQSSTNLGDRGCYLEYLSRVDFSIASRSRNNAFSIYFI